MNTCRCIVNLLLDIVSSYKNAQPVHVSTVDTYIRNLDLNVSASDIAQTRQKVLKATHRHMSFGKSLYIAKSIDYKTGKPLMYWLLNRFSQERLAKYKTYLSQQRLQLGRIGSHRYTMKEWWSENDFTQSIEHNNPSSAFHIQAGLSEMVKRAMPPMINDQHYDPVNYPLINDCLDDFAAYACVFNQVACYVAADHLPIQLDYWIIPQMMAQPPMGRSPIRLNMGRSNHTPKKHEKHFMGLGFEPTNRTELLIWDIEDLLKNQYIKNHDYYTVHVDITDPSSTEKLCGLLSRHFKEGGHRGHRYIFIIDRRHPENIEHKNLNNIPDITKKKHWFDKVYLICPKEYRNESGHPLCICGRQLQRKQSILHCVDTKCTVCTEELSMDGWVCPTHDHVHHGGYMLCEQCEGFRSDTHSTLSNDVELTPETCFLLSNNYMLPNPDGVYAGSIRELFNGYMFGFSYHILNKSNMFSYLYRNAGCIAFNPADIEWLWPRWFDTVNGKQQRLSDFSMKMIEHEKVYHLPNVEYAAFCKYIFKSNLYPHPISHTTCNLYCISSHDETGHSNPIGLAVDAAGTNDTVSDQTPLCIQSMLQYLVRFFLWRDTTRMTYESMSECITSMHMEKLEIQNQNEHLTDIQCMLNVCWSCIKYNPCSNNEFITRSEWETFVSNYKIGGFPSTQPAISINDHLCDTLIFIDNVYLSHDNVLNVRRCDLDGNVKGIDELNMNGCKKILAYLNAVDVGSISDHDLGVKLFLNLSQRQLECLLIKLPQNTWNLIGVNHQLSDAQRTMAHACIEQKGAQNDAEFEHERVTVLQPDMIYRYMDIDAEALEQQRKDEQIKQQSQIQRDEKRYNNCHFGGLIAIQPQYVDQMNDQDDEKYKPNEIAQIPLSEDIPNETHPLNITNIMNPKVDSQLTTTSEPTQNETQINTSLDNCKRVDEENSIDSNATDVFGDNNDEKEIQREEWELEIDRICADEIGVYSWDNRQVVNWLKQNNCIDAARIFDEHDVRGFDLVHMNARRLDSMTQMRTWQRNMLLRKIQELKLPSDNGKDHPHSGGNIFECINGHNDDSITELEENKLRIVWDKQMMISH
eukprot:827167_1